MSLNKINRQSFIRPPSSREILIPDLKIHEIYEAFNIMGGIATYDQLMKPTAKFMSLFMDLWIEEILCFTPSDAERLFLNLIDQSILQPIGGHSSILGTQTTITNTELESQLDSDRSEISSDLQEGMRRMIQFKAAKLMMSRLGMQDFSLMDIQRPDSTRLLRISSAIINFIRFRDGEQEKWRDTLAEWEAGDNEIKEIHSQITSATNELVRLRQVLEVSTGNDFSISGALIPASSQEIALGINNSGDLVGADMNLGNVDYSQNPRWLRTQELNNRLRVEVERLIKLSTLRAEECNSLKNIVNEKEQKVAALKKLISNLEIETKRLEEYSEKDPGDISKITEQLRSSLHSTEENLRSLELKERNMTKTIQTLQILDTELHRLTGLANSIVEGADSLELSRDHVARSKDKLETIKHKVEMAKNQRQRLQVQSESSKERLQSLRQEIESQEEEGLRKQAELIEESHKLTEEKAKAQAVIESIKADSNEISAKIDRVERQYAREFDEANAELANVHALVREYISEIRSLIVS